MKILLKKILEKLVLVILCLIIIFGNILLIYNIKNKFVNINEKFDIKNIIQNAKYVSLKESENDVTIVFDTNEKREEIKNIFDQINIRENKLNLMNKDEKNEYTLFIVDTGDKETYINFSNKKIMIYDETYETDFNVKKYFEKLSKK